MYILKLLVFNALLLLPYLALGQSTTITGELPDFNFRRFKEYVSAELYYTHDYLTNTKGIKTGPRNMRALDLYLESDFSKFSDVSGEFLAHYIHMNQNDKDANIGDAQGASNIDMPSRVDRIVDFWYKHHWTDEFSTQAGFHDISLDFNFTESTLSFLNSSFGTSAELVLSGPSVYPITTLGVMAQYYFNDSLNLKTGLYDANVGDETKYKSLHSNIGNHVGYMHISELAHEIKEQKVAIGEWNFTNPRDHLEDEQKKPLYGAYGIYERRISHSTWAFARYGWANPQISAIQSNLTSGLMYKGIFQRKKDQDEVGIGISQIHFSRHHLENVKAIEAVATSSEETAIEAYYNIKPFKILSLRPDLQYIIHPSGIKDSNNVWALGLRSVVQL